MSIKLQLPLKHILVNQPFGVNYVDFYKKMELKGHNGIDLRIRCGCKLYAAHSGRVTTAGVDGDGGVCIVIFNNKGKYKTIYYHLKDVAVNVGDNVCECQFIGTCDNTGKWTTGDHLHFGLKLTDQYGNTINYENGYHGAIDPTPYMPTDWDKTPAQKRYGRERTWKHVLFEQKVRFKNAWIHRQLIKRLRHPLSLTTEEVNMLVYGYWDFEDAINPAMSENCTYLTKPAFLNGDKPFA